MDITGTASDVADLTRLGEQIDDTLTNLLAFIEASDIFQKWNDAQQALEMETGITWTYFNSPYYDASRIDWTITLTGEGIEFAGEDRERDRLGFTMPYGFLSEETREDTLNALRQQYTATAGRQSEQERINRQRERDDAQREFDRAQARLAALDA